MDELKLAYLAGVKVGIESLVEGLKITAGKKWKSTTYRIC